MHVFQACKLFILFNERVAPIQMIAEELNSYPYIQWHHTRFQRSCVCISILGGTPIEIAIDYRNGCVQTPEAMFQLHFAGKEPIRLLFETVHRSRPPKEQ